MQILLQANSAFNILTFLEYLLLLYMVYLLQY